MLRSGKSVSANLQLLSCDSYNNGEELELIRISKVRSDYVKSESIRTKLSVPTYASP